jgi:hypothetical protein
MLGCGIGEQAAWRVLHDPRPHRKAELETMLSPELAELVRSKKIRLLTYQELIARAGGPSAMRRPPPSGTTS